MNILAPDFVLIQVFISVAGSCGNSLLNILRNYQFPKVLEKYYHQQCFLFILNKSLFFFWDRVLLCSPGWPGTCDPPASAF
jgi:hypothetical protein